MTRVLSRARPAADRDRRGLAPPPVRRWCSRSSPPSRVCRVRDDRGRARRCTCRRGRRRRCRARRVRGGWRCGCRPSSTSCCMTALIVDRRAGGCSAVGRGRRCLRDAAAALFPVVYIGLPLGALAAVRASGGRDGDLLLLMAPSSSATRRSTTPAGHSAGGRWRRQSARRRPSKARRRHGLRHAGDGGRRRLVFPASPAAAARARRRGDLAARHRRRPVRVAAEAQRRREGLVARSFPATAACSIGSTAGCSPRRSTTCSSRYLCDEPTDMKRVAILGSTGSIGQSALAVVDAHPDDCASWRWRPASNVARLAEQVARYSPDTVAMATAAGLPSAPSCAAWRRAPAPSRERPRGPDRRRDPSRRRRRAVRLVRARRRSTPCSRRSRRARRSRSRTRKSW